MRFAISIPQFFADGEFDPPAFRAHLRRVEELGYDSAWTQEQVLTMHAQPQLGAIETMTYAAACTEHLRLGCSVFVTTLHNPVHLAKALSSLDQLSRGRLEIGVGHGGQGRMFSAFGVDPEGLVSRFTENLHLMRELWTRPSVTFDGRFWQLENAKMEPKPFQKPAPPVWFGGHHRNALRRAVRLGDGFFGAGSSTTERFAEEVRTLRALLAESDRDPDEFRLAKRIYIAVDDDADRARTRIAQKLEKLYGTPNIAAVAVAGTPDDCVRGVREVIDAGAELVLFTPMSAESEQAERLAAEVIPRLR
ncbi:LLM class F420-dependent oxidoreductase [Nocardia sp. BMG51109]|uniref:LLM class F420-dependent oxidoreductase n=1 Tax=Nocardia sp. BMG51109 TaxID=1056816 RepID=UPI0004670FE1|nr:LLM class F420-dependent oxidoreductase [Nocardia sp. BMG51109]